MAIHVIQSQRIDVLLQAMLKTVKSQSAHALQVLKTQHFIVPSPAVEAWLTQQLAEQKGISANTQFHHRIRAFQWTAYQWVLDQDKEQVRKANIPRIIIKWRVYQALLSYIEPEQCNLSSEHPLYSIVQRIYASADQLQQGLAKQLKKQSMLYWVAEQVSRLFSHYMEYRGHCQKNCPINQCSCPSNWLQRWGRNQALPIEQMFFQTNNEISAFTLNQAHELEAWQRWLWQVVFHQDFLDMQQIDAAFWQALGSVDAPNSAALKKLPQPLVVFTLLDLPPSQLQFLQRLGQYIDIYLLHYNPSQEYWADSVDPNWKARYDLRVKERFIAKHPQATDAEIQQFFQDFTLHFNAEVRESRHPLLTRFGKPARDHFSLLSGLSSGEDGVWADVFVDEYPASLLGKLQSDILYLVEPEANQYVLDAEDESIQIHVCHSSLRQLEVLKDQLTAWLAQGSKQQPRRPSDILVLSPNLKELEPLIRSVFAPPVREPETEAATAVAGRLSQDTIYLPVKIAGVTQLDATNAWRAVLGRMQLVQGRFRLDDFADWLGLAATQQCYALEMSAVERMLELLQQAGFKRGLDAPHLALSLTEGDTDYRFSFKFALDRLTLGIAIPEHTLFADTLSFAEVMPSDFELIAKLLQIYQDLDARRDWLLQHEQSEQPKQVEHWLKVLLQEVAEFEQAGVEALASVAQIIKKQVRMLTLSNFYEGQDQYGLDQLTLPLTYVLDEIQTTLDAQLDQAEPTGQITFSQLGQIRPIPYQLIVMLNLDSGKFPSRNQHLPFDLMDLLKPQLGDRSRLEDDQGAFLDGLLLAQQSLWLFYNGFDVNDGEVREPSTALQELVQHLAFITQRSAEAELIQVQGLEIPAQLHSLYHIHPLQPFDWTGFIHTKPTRFQDHWFRVAQQIVQPQGQRQAWQDTPYLTEVGDFLSIQSQQWIQDVCFPARLYLRTLGVENLKAENLPDEVEPLVLDGLGRYAVRHFLQQQGQNLQPELLLDQLPVGKMQQAAWQVSINEQQQLRARLARYADAVTAVTQQLWNMTPTLQFQITLPAQHTQKWVSLEASSARAKRRVQLWLEYLLWLAHENLADAGQDLARIVVFSDQTILCQGVSSNQAKAWLAAWFELWQQGQTEPVVLPAALLFQVAEKGKTHEWEPDDQGKLQLKDWDSLLKTWQDDGRFAGFSVLDNEASQHHRDWQFILQQQDASALLAQACQRFSERLYAPIFEYQQVIEE